MDATDRRRRASAEASRWFALLQSDQMRDEERAQFIDWLRETPVHVAEMLRIVHVHGALEQFNLWHEVITGPKAVADEHSVIFLEPPVAPAAAPQKSFRRPVRLVAGLTCALVVVTTLLVAFLGRGQVIDTERGERRELVLADGSVLQVDPETRLRVKYTEDFREVLLERGRVMFHVAKNPHRPFLVRSERATVRAVGTAFGVERQIHNIVVTVAEGRVAVTPVMLPTPAGSDQSAPTGQAPSPAAVPGSASGSLINLPTHQATKQTIPAGSSHREVFLAANQQLIVQASGSAEAVHEVDSHQALAWAEGRLVFHNDTLETAVAQFNRYNRVQITVADPVLAAHPINGVFNALQPESFLAFLKSAAGIQVTRDGDQSITLRPPITRSR